MPAHKIVRPTGAVAAALLLMMVVTVFSCKNVKEVIGFKLSPPIPALNPALNEFTIDAAMGGQIDLPSGTSIIVPPLALIDKQGNTIQGKATIKYREFHKADEVFLSGIPLAYTDSMGIDRIMQTGGMFEITAAQDGNELAIAENKNITVNLASYIGEDGYSNFVFNNETGTWTETGVSDAQQSKRKVQLQMKKTKLEKDAAVIKNSNYFVFNYNTLLDVYYGDEVWNVKQNKAKVLAKAEKYNIAYSSIFNNDDIIFNGKYEVAGLMVWKNVSGKKLPKFKENTWASLKQLKGNEYKMEVTDEKDKLLFTGKVKAEMPLKKLFAISPEEWNGNYDAVMRRVDSLYKQLSVMADFTRTVVVGNFGVYNCDRFINNAKRLDVVATLKFENEPGADIKEEMKLYYMCGENNTVTTWDIEGLSTMILLPDTNACLFTLYPDGTAALFSKEDFKQLNFETLKQPGKNEVTFRLKMMDKPVKSAADIKQLLST
jgi:hypothetical protein